MPPDEILSGRAPVATPSPLALYVHIPFCLVRCPYCDFNTYQGLDALIPPYVAALGEEIRLWGAILGRPVVRSVFFGGGTPSYIPAGDLAGTLRRIRTAFRLEGDVEVTVECNPGDLDPARLEAFRVAGANRISIGVQSFDDDLLRTIGRRHTAEEARRAYRTARAAGFDNVSLDLMFGLPGETFDRWRRTLDEALGLEPPHLSMYALTLEKGTAMEKWVRCGEMAEPDPDLAADMYDLARARASEAGYRHYEISNWARPGRECHHNLTYWRNEPYLGLGAGAFSYLPGVRFANVKGIGAYAARIAGWAARGPEALDGPIDPERLARLGVAAEIEPIERRDEIVETIFVGLRLLAGLDLAAFRDRFGEDLDERYGPVVRGLVEDGLLERAEGTLRLTPAGTPVANRVVLRFL